MPRFRISSRTPFLLFSLLITLNLVGFDMSPPAWGAKPHPAPALPNAPAPQNQRPTPRARFSQSQSSRQLLWQAPSADGIRPVFTATNNWNAPPLTFRQKSFLYLRQITGPWIAVTSLMGAGFGQIDNNPAYGQGAQGYFKRVASNYADQVDGDFWHNLVLPQILHEDPRYFRKGSGPVLHRFLWAAAAPVWARRDNKTWGINYSHIAGNLIGSAIGNVYYAPSNRTAGQTVGRAFLGLADSTIASELAEFWPDIACRIQIRRNARRECRSHLRQSRGMQKPH